ncbi:MAG: YitT family protein [Bacteroidales bacterium]
MENIKPFVLLANLSKTKLVRDYALILLGSAIVASGYVFFFTPYKIIPGGVYGIAIILHYITAGWFSFFPEGLPIGTTALIFNIPLWIAAYKLLGPTYGPKTVVTFVATSIFTDTFAFLQGQNVLVSNDPLLASIYGGALVGLGVSLIFKARGTSAGTDVLAKIIAKYSQGRVGSMIMLIDSCIVLLGLVVFRSWDVPLYSWIAIFVYGRVVDAITEGIRTEKAVLIVSNKQEEMRDAILFTLNRGGTFLQGKGMFSGEPKDVIYTVVPKQQIFTLKEIVNQVDPTAFVTVLPAYEILGKGFRSLEKTIQEEK